MNDVIMRNSRYDDDVLDKVEQWFEVRINRNGRVDPQVLERTDFRVDGAYVPIC